jgi:hypothetical protein
MIARAKEGIMSEKGTCEGCGNLCVILRIESGQMVCTACYREIKPPRPRHLASYTALNRFTSEGIILPFKTTAEEANTLLMDRSMLVYTIRDVRYQLLEQGFDYSGGDSSTLETMSWTILKTGEFGKRLAQAEREGQPAVFRPTSSGPKVGPSDFLLARRPRAAADEDTGCLGRLEEGHWNLRIGYPVFRPDLALKRIFYSCNDPVHLA